MKININKTLLAIDGIHNMNFPFKETEKDKDGKEITVNKIRDLIYQDVFIGSLNATVQKVTQQGFLIPESYSEKRFKYKLFKKVRDTKKENNEIIVEFSVGEIEILKEALGKTQSPLIIGQCDELIYGE
jgi:hypothetical protein